MIEMLSLQVDAQGRIAEDLRCVKCRYNLRGLHIRGRCPECGLRARTTILRRERRVIVWFGYCRFGSRLLGYANYLLAVSFGLGFLCVVGMLALSEPETAQFSLYSPNEVLQSAAICEGMTALVFSLLFTVVGSLLISGIAPCETGQRAKRARYTASACALLMPILLGGSYAMRDQPVFAVALSLFLLAACAWLLAMHVHIETIGKLLSDPELIRGSRFWRRTSMSVAAFAAVGATAAALVSEKPVLAGLAALPGTVLLVGIGLFYLRMSRAAAGARERFRWASRLRLRTLMEAHRISELAPRVESVAQTGGPLA